jgi:hypothetical protein
MSKNTNTKKKTDRPIRLWKLEPGSTCTIFAEPSRGIFKSKDKTVYRRDTENTILVDVADENHVAILMPEDLVVPLSRPKHGGKR